MICPNCNQEIQIPDDKYYRNEDTVTHCIHHCPLCEKPMGRTNYEWSENGGIIITTILEINHGK